MCSHMYDVFLHIWWTSVICFFWKLLQALIVKYFQFHHSGWDRSRCARTWQNSLSKRTHSGSIYLAGKTPVSRARLVRMLCAKLTAEQGVKDILSRHQHYSSGPYPSQSTRQSNLRLLLWPAQDYLMVLVANGTRITEIHGRKGLISNA